MNYNRMTIRQGENGCAVFKLKPTQVGGYATDMAAKRFIWHVSAVAKPIFIGSDADCMKFIADSGAEFMSEHGIPC